MRTAIRGPGDRYRLAFEALCCTRGSFYTHHRSGPGTAQEDGSVKVAVPDACTLVVVPGENGLTVRSVRLAKGCRTLITAVVTAGPGAPEWLPPESTYLLFEGAKADAAELTERYIPFDGMMAEEEPGGDQPSPLDRLAVAVGRSVARANAQLARVRQEAGTALVSSLNIRVGLGQITINQGRVMVNLARPEDGDTGQFVELTLTPAPSVEPDEEENQAMGRSGRIDSPRTGL